MAMEILSWSRLPAHPAPEPNGPYVMHLALAEFLYRRFLRTGTSNLYVQDQAGAAVLSDGQISYAKGPGTQIDGLLQFMISLVEVQRATASELEAELKTLEADRKTLLRQLSLVIAAKKLKGKCSLVRFF